MKEKIKNFLSALNPAGVVYWSAIAVLVAIVIGLIFTILTMDKPSEPDIPTEYTHTVYLIIQEETEFEPESETPEVTDEAEETGYQYTEEEIRMIAQLTMAEAGNQSELGKRLVIDVVLNRVDHPDPQYPDTVQEVIYQKNQFSPISDGRFEKCYATEENIQLVKEEIERRTDHDVMFFRTKRYSDYGVPLYCVGDHYFSSFS